VRPGLLADRCQLVADLLDGGVPGYPRPLTVDELHRVFQTPVAVHEFAHCSALGAMRAAIDRAFPARLLADPHAIRDLRPDGAAGRAVRADMLADRDRSAGRRRRPRCGLAYRAKRQCAERRQTAGRETGAAQKTASVEAYVPLPLQRRGEPAALRLTLRPLDQHGCLPSVTVDPVQRVDSFGCAITRLALLAACFGVGRGFTRKRPDACRRNRSASAEGAKKFATAELCVRYGHLISLHRRYSF